MTVDSPAAVEATYAAAVGGIRGRYDAGTQ